MSDMEMVDAEKEFLLFCGSHKVEPTPANRLSFIKGLEFALNMADNAKVREGFQLERFRRAFMLSGQLYQLLVQCATLLNEIRKRLIVGPDSKPVDSMGIGKTIEIVATALKSAKTIILTLDKVSPDANGNPVNG